jgi:hypothetical protein
MTGRLLEAVVHVRYPFEKKSPAVVIPNCLQGRIFRRGEENLEAERGWRPVGSVLLPYSASLGPCVFSGVEVFRGPRNSGTDRWRFVRHDGIVARVSCRGPYGDPAAKHATLRSPVRENRTALTGSRSRLHMDFQLPRGGYHYSGCTFEH